MFFKFLEEEVNDLVDLHSFEFLEDGGVFDVEIHSDWFLWLGVGLRLIDRGIIDRSVIEGILLIENSGSLAVEWLFMFFDGFEVLLWGGVNVWRLHF